MNTTTISVDIAKSVFQVSVANSAGRVVDRKRLSRGQFQRFLAQQSQAEIIMEACATSHHWARTAREHGHRPRLLHPHYVKPYVRRNKTDAADADALLRAAGDPDLKPVPVKSVDHQALQGLHRVRAQWQATRRQRICMARALLAEFGVHLPTGAAGIVAKLTSTLEQAAPLLATSLAAVVDEIRELDGRIRRVDKELAALAKRDDVAQRLLTIPGIGILTATALIASVPDIHAFRRARAFAAWLGLTPREYSSGLIRHRGGITKRGDRYLRMLLVHGARSALQCAHRQALRGEAVLTPLQRWVLEVEQRTNHNKAAIALANKMARIVWCVWTREEVYRA